MSPIKVLFIQGGGKGAHDEWDNKLAASLRQHLGGGYEIDYPRMPKEDDPSYDRWKVALQQPLAKLPDGAIVVGHSLGATMLLKLLSDFQPSPAEGLGAIFLAATPFVGPGAGRPTTCSSRTTWERCCRRTCRSISFTASRMRLRRPSTSTSTDEPFRKPGSIACRAATISSIAT